MSLLIHSYQEEGARKGEAFMATEIQIRQGNQIGGCVTIITYIAEGKNIRIMIDYGMSLPGAEKKRIINMTGRGIRWTPSCSPTITETTPGDFWRSRRRPGCTWAGRRDRL